MTKTIYGVFSVYQIEDYYDADRLIKTFASTELAEKFIETITAAAVRVEKEDVAVAARFRPIVNAINDLNLIYDEQKEYNILTNNTNRKTMTEVQRGRLKELEQKYSHYRAEDNKYRENQKEMARQFKNELGIASAEDRMLCKKYGVSADIDSLMLNAEKLTTDLEVREVEFDE